MEYYTDGVLKYYIHNGNELGCCGYADDNKKPAKIVIPEKVLGHRVSLISGQAFQNEDNLEEVVFTQSIEHISNYAFADCKNLKTINIKHTFIDRLPLRIAKFAFINCPNLEQFTTANRKIHLEMYAFSNCNNLTKLFAFICETEPMVFSNCPKLENIVIGNGASCEKDSFKNSSVKQVCFEGTVAHIEKVKQWLQKNMQIVCRSNSNIAELAYEGYSVTVQ